MRSPPKYPQLLGTDDIWKDLEISATVVGVPRDAAVSAALAQINREDTEKIGEEGIDSRQRGQTPSLWYLLRQSLSMQWSLADLITII